jgi:hypothetical protein
MRWQRGSIERRGPEAASPFWPAHRRCPHARTATTPRNAAGEPELLPRASRRQSGARRGARVGRRWCRGASRHAMVCHSWLRGGTVDGRRRTGSTQAALGLTIGRLSWSAGFRGRTLAPCRMGYGHGARARARAARVRPGQQRHRRGPAGPGACRIDERVVVRRRSGERRRRRARGRRRRWLERRRRCRRLGAAVVRRRGRVLRR